MTLKESQSIVDQWIKKYGVRYFNELTNMTLLMEEVGELARVVARKYGEQSCKGNESDMSLDEELADILFVLICLANQTNVDLETALNASLEKKTNRDNKRHQTNTKLQ